MYRSSKHQNNNTLALRQPLGGMNNVLSPEFLDDNQAAELINVEYDEAGKTFKSSKKFVRHPYDTQFYSRLYKLHSDAFPEPKTRIFGAWGGGLKDLTVRTTIAFGGEPEDVIAYDGGIIAASSNKLLNIDGKYNFSEIPFSKNPVAFKEEKYSWPNLSNTAAPLGDTIYLLDENALLISFKDGEFTATNKSLPKGTNRQLIESNGLVYYIVDNKIYRVYPDLTYNLIYTHTSILNGNINFLNNKCCIFQEGKITVINLADSTVREIIDTRISSTNIITSTDRYIYLTPIGFGSLFYVFDGTSLYKYAEYQSLISPIFLFCQKNLLYCFALSTENEDTNKLNWNFYLITPLRYEIIKTNIPNPLFTNFINLKDKLYFFGTIVIGYENSVFHADINLPKTTINIVLIKDGRLVVNQGSTLYFSGVGDFSNWNYDTDSDALYVEIGYKEEGNIIKAAVVLNDIIVFKDNGNIYRLSGSYPNWNIYKMGHTDTIISNIFVMGSEILFGSKNGIKKISVTQNYGDFILSDFQSNIIDNEVTDIFSSIETNSIIFSSFDYIFKYHLALNIFSIYQNISAKQFIENYNNGIYEKYILDNDGRLMVPSEEKNDIRVKYKALKNQITAVIKAITLYTKPLPQDKEITVWLNDNVQFNVTLRRGVNRHKIYQTKRIDYLQPAIAHDGDFFVDDFIIDYAITGG